MPPSYKELVDFASEPESNQWSALCLRLRYRVRGYNVVGWVRGGMAYEAVSDLNTAELTDFARLMRTTP